MQTVDMKGHSGTDIADGPPRAWWQERRVATGAAAAIVVLALASAWFAHRASIARERMELLETQAAEGFLAPPSTTRTVAVNLESGRTIGLGGGTPERVEFRIDARSNKFNLFRVALARDDGTAVLHFDRLQRDSNGEIRFALNSTLLPPGSYTIRVEGFTWRGETVPVGRIGLKVVR